jgi:hypothetical protein
MSEMKANLFSLIPTKNNDETGKYQETKMEELIERWRGFNVIWIAQTRAICELSSVRKLGPKQRLSSLLPVRSAVGIVLF